jgi:hypothetical protein
LPLALTGVQAGRVLLNYGLDFRWGDGRRWLGIAGQHGERVMVGIRGLLFVVIMLVCVVSGLVFSGGDGFRRTGRMIIAGADRLVALGDASVVIEITVECIQPHIAVYLSTLCKDVEDQGKIGTHLPAVQVVSIALLCGDAAIEASGVLGYQGVESCRGDGVRGLTRFRLVLGVRGVVLMLDG